MGPDHFFVRAANPRMLACVRCGLPEDMHEPVPVKVIQADPPRDVEWERAFALESAKLAGTDATALVDFAMRRCQPGPVRQFLTRDLEQDLAEELADAVNYATWEADRARRTGEDLEKLQRAARVIGYMALAYAELTA